MPDNAVSLFNTGSLPLAEKLRPKKLEDFVGYSRLDPLIAEQLRAGKGRLPNIILWGPPGCGKTTLARLLATRFDVEMIELSAVQSGVKEIREVADRAKHSLKPSVMFLDEIHRLNKAQQDSLLPFTERGTFSLVGATTENPSFYLNAALLSRSTVVVLPGLSEEDLGQLASRALTEVQLKIQDDAIQVLVHAASGDARWLIQTIERLSVTRAHSELTKKELSSILPQLRHDKSGDSHYDFASAFIKSMRGSDADAALFYAFRMIEAGDDPRFILRRMMIFASEDIGNADPNALLLATATADAYDRIGLPEGKIPIAHCICYLASAPKSNRSYMAMHKAIDAVKRFPAAAPPLHLRNAPTKLMKELGNAKDYQYPHDFADGIVGGVQYLPEELANEVFYEPSNIGREGKISEQIKKKGNN